MLGEGRQAALGSRLGVRGHVRRVPRDRPQRRELPCPVAPRLGHDTVGARAATLPAGVCDGELAAIVDDLPDFPTLCSRLLNGERSVAIAYVVFDLLAVG